MARPNLLLQPYINILEILCHRHSSIQRQVLGTSRYGCRQRGLLDGQRFEMGWFRRNSEKEQRTLYQASFRSQNFFDVRLGYENLVGDYTRHTSDVWPFDRLTTGWIRLEGRAPEYVPPISPRWALQATGFSL